MKGILISRKLFALHHVGPWVQSYLKDFSTHRLTFVVGALSTLQQGLQLILFLVLGPPLALLRSGCTRALPHHLIQSQILYHKVPCPLLTSPSVKEVLEWEPGAATKLVGKSKTITGEGLGCSPSASQPSSHPPASSLLCFVQQSSFY